MNQEVKKLWVEALKSGNYKQGRGGLHPDQETYCCLGVLCDLFQTQTKQGKWLYEPDIEERYFEAGVVRDPSYLPSIVINWACLENNDPMVIIDERTSVSRNLSALNDSGYSFISIAELIEKCL